MATRICRLTSERVTAGCAKRLGTTTPPRRPFGSGVGTGAGGVAGAAARAGSAASSTVLWQTCAGPVDNFARSVDKAHAEGWGQRPDDARRRARCEHIVPATSTRSKSADRTMRPSMARNPGGDSDSQALAALARRAAMTARNATGLPCGRGNRGCGRGGSGALVGVRFMMVSLVERRRSGWRRRADCFVDPKPRTSPAALRRAEVSRTRRLFRTARAKVWHAPHALAKTGITRNTVRQVNGRPRPEHADPGVLPRVDRSIDCG